MLVSFRNNGLQDIVNLNRIRNSLCVVFGLVLLAIYYKYPIGHLSPEQSVWLALKIMVVVFACAWAFEWLSNAAAIRSKAHTVRKSRGRSFVGTAPTA